MLSETSRFFTSHDVRPALVYRTEQDERALAMVGAGLGITVMPEHYQGRGVTRIPLVGFVERRRVAWCTRRQGGVARNPKRARCASWSLRRASLGGSPSESSEFESRIRDRSRVARQHVNGTRGGREHHRHGQEQRDSR